MRLPQAADYSLNLQAAIRGFWTFALPGVGFVLAYLAEQWMDLDLPRWTGLALGAFAYALKKKLLPDSLI